jgi:hypothetical protein
LPTVCCFNPQHSIIDQSLHAELGGFTTNGDGFGIGWYDPDNGTKPAVFKGTHPAWNDQNLREVAAQIRTPLLFVTWLIVMVPLLRGVEGAQIAGFVLFDGYSPGLGLPQGGSFRGPERLYRKRERCDGRTRAAA